MTPWHCSWAWLQPLQPHLGSGLAAPPAEPLSQLSTASSSAEARGSITALKLLDEGDRGLQAPSAGRDGTASTGPGTLPVPVCGGICRLCHPVLPLCSPDPRGREQRPAPDVRVGMPGLLVPRPRVGDVQEGAGAPGPAGGPG